MLVQVMLSFGYIDALIPLLIIIVLIAAAAGLIRKWEVFELFGIEVLAGLGGGGKGSLAKKTAYGSKISQPARGQKMFALPDRLSKKMNPEPGEFESRAMNAGKNLRENVMARAQVNQATNSLTKYVTNQPSGTTSTLGQTPIGKAFHKVNSALYATFSNPGFRTMTGLGAMSVGLFTPLGYNRMSKNEYEHSKIEYENAVKAGDEKAKEKWAAKIYEMQEKHGFVPTSQLEFDAAKEVKNDLEKQIKRRAPGSVLSNEDISSMGKRLIRVENAMQFNRNIEDVRKEYRRTKDAVEAEKKVRNLVEKYIKEHKNLGEIEVEAATMALSRNGLAAPQIRAYSKPSSNSKKMQKIAQQAAVVAVTGGFAAPLLAGNWAQKKAQKKMGEALNKAIGKKEFKKDFEDELKGLTKQEKEKIADNRWGEYMEGRKANQKEYLKMLGSKEYSDTLKADLEKKFDKELTDEEVGKEIKKMIGKNYFDDYWKNSEYRKKLKEQLQEKV
jgi:hypothetical protein